MNRENIKKLDTARGISPAGRFAYTAISTPPGVSGVAVIRLCGQSAFLIAQEIFNPISPSYKDVNEIPAYSCAYGKIVDDNADVLDYVVLTKFCAPNSYTGEDTIEISCHGGHGVKSSILSLLYDHGARPALPGEFTKNAFLNGKIDLSQAEAVMDLISSNAKMSSIAAARQLEGNLSAKIKGITSKLYEIMAKVEMIIEFPEHEESTQAINIILKDLLGIKKELDSLIDTFKQGKILKEGFTVAIMGKPNAGKSSMLNSLIGYQRAIVTEIPGTTRDTIEEMVEIDGLPVKLIDTAGIRSSSDTVEKIGIDIAKKTAVMSDLIFWISSDEIIDADSLVNSDDDFGYLLKMKEEINPVLIIGKSDIIPWEKNKEKLTKLFPHATVIPFSSVTGEGIKQVRRIIKKEYDKLGVQKDQEILITSHRHLNLLTDANESLDMSIATINDNIPADILASALRSVADKLSEITGDQVSEQLVDEIFSRFCIGK